MSIPDIPAPIVHASVGAFFSPRREAAQWSVQFVQYFTFLKIYCVLILLFASTAWPQSSVKVRGLVLDAQTGEPLPAANVQVEGTALGAAANVSGRFEIENLLNGEYVLRISHVGYAMQQQRIIVQNGPAESMIIRLRPSVIPMRPVEISVEREPHDASDDTIVLTREMIQRAQAADLGDVLKTVGGLQLVDDGGKKSIRIRGARANQTLVLLDGVKLNDQLTGDVDLAHVPVHSIERVEIKKGSAAEYGSGALGGLIKITTIAAAPRHLSLGADAGAFGLQTLHALLGRRFGPVDLMASVQKMDNAGVFPYRYSAPNADVISDKRQNSDVHSKSLFGRMGFARGDHKATLKAQAFSSDRGAPGKVFYRTPYARIQSVRRMTTFDYAFTRKKWRLRASAGASSFRTENRNLRPTVEEFAFGSTPEFHFRNELSSLNIDIDMEQRANAWLSAFWGYDGRRVLYRDKNMRLPGAQAIGEAEDKSYGVYAKQEIKKTVHGVRLLLTPVLRYDEAILNSAARRRFERQWNPGLRFFLSCGKQPRAWFRAEANRGFRMPTFADLFYQDFRVQGKADLTPEKSSNIEVGAGAHFIAWVNVHFDASLFHNKIDDMIVWRLGSFEFFRPYNTDAELFGEEYSLQLQTLSKNASLDLFYAHLRALNKNDNETLHNKMLPYRAEHSFKANVRVNGRRWQSSAGLRSVGRRFITEANTKDMPPYAVLDWNAEWTASIGHVDLQWRLAVFNLFDERYEIVRDMPLPGREWRIGLHIHY